MDPEPGTEQSARRGRPAGRLGRPSTLDRDGALRAARDVIAARGFDRTRYSDVADASGVPVTTLQHAFGSLGAMLLESVQRTAAAEIAVLRELSTDTTLTPWERLGEFVAGAVHPPDEPDSWLLWLELWRLAGRDAEVGARAGIIYEQWWDYVAELIRLGAEAGAFTGAICATPREAAIAVVGIVDGIAAALIVRADGPQHERTRALAMDAIASMLGYTG